MKIYNLFYLNENKKEEEGEEFINELVCLNEDKEEEEEEEDFEKSKENFIKKNKYKYKIIFKNKIYPLQFIIKIMENNIEQLTFKLICYKNILDNDKIHDDFSLHKYFKFKRLKNKKNMNMYKSKDYLLYSSYEIQKLIYKINNKDRINIFGQEFVGNNGNKCSIIYKDKIIPLQPYFLIKDIKKEDKENKKFELILLVLENISDGSYMFYDCESLVKFCNFEINNSEIKDNIIEEENHFISENILKFNNFYPKSIDDDKLNKKIIHLSKETYFNFFKLEFDKIDKEKRNNYFCSNNMNFKFSGCLSLISLPEISKRDTNNEKNYIFSECSQLISLPYISKWNTDNVNNMSFMFSGCSSLISLPDITKWNTKNVNNTISMFEGCSSLISLPDISKWNTYNINDMSFMFSGCSSLISLPDISKWNTSNVNNTISMFSECSSLISLPDISNWNIQNVYNINSMFEGCSSLISLPEILKWNINNINNMNSVFSGCSSLISLSDISKWNTNNVIDMNFIFSGCSSLISLPDISKWNTDNINNINSMFEGCSSSIYLPHLSNINI